MKNITSVLLISTLAASTACTTMKTTDTSTTEIPAPDASLANNPFMKKSSLQYQAPEFNNIKDEHFKPAFDYGMKIQLAEIDKIANNSAAAMTSRRIVPLPKSCTVGAVAD